MTQTKGRLPRKTVKLASDGVTKKEPEAHERKSCKYESPKHDRAQYSGESVKRIVRPIKLAGKRGTREDKKEKQGEKKSRATRRKYGKGGAKP